MPPSLEFERLLVQVRKYPRDTLAYKSLHRSERTAVSWACVEEERGMLLEDRQTPGRFVG